MKTSIKSNDNLSPLGSVVEKYLYNLDYSETQHWDISAATITTNKPTCILLPSP